MSPHLQYSERRENSWREIKVNIGKWWQILFALPLDVLKSCTLCPLTLPQFGVLTGVTQDSHDSICFPEVNVHKDPDGQRRRGWQMSNLKASLGNVRKKQKNNCFSQVLARAFYVVLFNCIYWSLLVIFRQRWRSLITEQEKGVVFVFVTFFVIDPIVWLGQFSSVLDVLFPGERSWVLHTVPLCLVSHHHRAVSCASLFFIFFTCKDKKKHAFVKITQNAFFCGGLPHHNVKSRSLWSAQCEEMTRAALARVHLNGFIKSFVICS